METMRCLFFAYRPFRLLAGGGWAAARDGIVIFWHFASVLVYVLTVLVYVLTVLVYVLTVLEYVLTVLEYVLLVIVRVSAIFDCFAAGYVEGSGKISKFGAIAWRRGEVGCGAEIRAIESSRRGNIAGGLG